MNESLDEIIKNERDFLEYKASDDELKIAIDNAIKESKEQKDIADLIGERNEKYWKNGTNLSKDETHPKKAKIIDNRIFMSVETIIPMVTARTPEPEIAGDIDNTLREKLIKMLTIAYEVKLKVKQKLQRIVRHWFLYRIGIWKYRWDDGFILETVKPKKMGFDPRAGETGVCEYMWEQLEDNLENLLDKFPKKAKELSALYGKNKGKKRIKYYEFWGGGGEWVAWKLGNILLDKKKNPNFDYGSPAKGTEDEEGYEPAQGPANNLFKKPQFPYLILKVFNLGDQLYDDSSLIEQAIPLQDGTNKRKCQISDLIEENKTVITVSSNAMSKEEAQKLVDKYGMILIWLDRGNIADIKVDGGQVDMAMYNDMAHSIAEIDNLMGTHSTTRGERQEAETLGGRQLLTAADYGRTETVVENVEQLMEDLYNAYLHCIKVYSLEDASFSNGTETVKINPQTEIPNDIMALVKKGSSLPVDKAARAEMSIKLAQFGMIDPPTLFEELGYGKEAERTKRLYEWLAATGKINPEYVAGMQAPMGGEQQKSQQLQRVQQMVSSPQFQQLPPEQQKEAVGRAKQIVQAIKSGGTPPMR